MTSVISDTNKSDSGVRPFTSVLDYKEHPYRYRYTREHTCYLLVKTQMRGTTCTIMTRTFKSSEKRCQGSIGAATSWGARKN